MITYFDTPTGSVFNTDLSPAAALANASIREYRATYQEARDAWAMIKDATGGVMAPINEASALEAAARGTATRLDQAARRFAGMVTRALGEAPQRLFLVTNEAEILTPDSFSHGDEYIDVADVCEFSPGSARQGLSRRFDVPVSDILAVFDSKAQADEYISACDF